MPRRRCRRWSCFAEPTRGRHRSIPAACAASTSTRCWTVCGSLSNDPSLPQVHVSGPEDQLRSITSRTRITGNRLAVPVGALLVLFFGVAVLAGLGGRADHQRAVSVLRRSGADRAAIMCFRSLEAIMPVIVGLVVGVRCRGSARRLARTSRWAGGHEHRSSIARRCGGATCSRGRGRWRSS